MIRAVFPLIVATCCTSVTSSQDLLKRDIPQQNIVQIDKAEQQNRYVSFPSAGVRLIRPDGFDPANLFNGFQQPSTQSSVMVTTLPGPFSQMSGGFTAERMKTRGLILKSRENISIDSNPGLLINLTQTATGNEFTKWILIFGNEQNTKIITATFLTADTDKLSARLKAVVLSTKIDLATSSAINADIGFSVTAASKMKSVSGVGKMLVYTQDGVIPAKSPTDPLFLVTRSFSDLVIADRQKFALQRLLKTESVKIDSVPTTTAFKIDGLDGYEMVADAKKTMAMGSASQAMTKSMYQCPMHKDMQSNKPGHCSKCGMTLPSV